MNGPTGSNGKTIILTDKFDPDHYESIGVRIPELMATVTNRDMEDLHPLYYSIDTDALENLMAQNSHIEVHFEYEGYEVVIRNDNTIEILTLPD